MPHALFALTPVLRSFPGVPYAAGYRPSRVRRARVVRAHLSLS